MGDRKFSINLGIIPTCEQLILELKQLLPRLQFEPHGLQWLCLLTQPGFESRACAFSEWLRISKIFVSGIRNLDRRMTWGGRPAGLTDQSFRRTDSSSISDSLRRIRESGGCGLGWKKVVDGINRPSLSWLEIRLNSKTIKEIHFQNSGRKPIRNKKIHFVATEPKALIGANYLNSLLWY